MMCDPPILQVLCIVYFQLKERIISPINPDGFVYDRMLTVKIVHYRDQIFQLDRIINQLLDLVKKQKLKRNIDLICSVSVVFCSLKKNFHIQKAPGPGAFNFFWIF